MLISDPLDMIVCFHEPPCQAQVCPSRPWHCALGEQKKLYMYRVFTKDLACVHLMFFRTYQVQLCRSSASCFENHSQSFTYIHIYTHNIDIIYDQTMFQHGWLQAWLGSGWKVSGTTLNNNRRLLPGFLFF